MRLTDISAKNILLESQSKDTINTDKISRQLNLVENTNNTNTLATVLSELESRGIRYAYFDKDVTINLDTALEIADRLLIGKTKIGKAIADNFLYNISDNMQSFQGKLNKNNCKFTRLKTAIASGNPLNFTIWGDSLSTNGGLLNANTTNVSGAERGPDNITEGDSYTSYLYDMLSDVFYDKTVNFHNVAISGTRLTEWNTDKYLYSATKTWIEHVKSTTPDVLFIAFGANHNTRDLQKAFAYTLKQVIDYINTNFIIKPDIVLVSTPRPSYKPSTVWGNYLGQSTRQGVANIVRNLTPKYKCYLMDVNRNYNIKRCGTDFLNPTFKEISNIAPYITNVKDGNGNYVLNSITPSLIVNKYMKDFVLKFTLTFSGANTDNDVLTIKTNHTYDSSFYNNQIVIYPKLSTNSNFGFIKTATNIADYANWTTASTATKSLTEAITTIDLRIEKRDNILEIHREGTDSALWSLLLKDRVNVWDINGLIQFSLSVATTGFNATISNLRIFEPTYNNYLPTLTDKDAYGYFDINDTTTVRPETGGNGVNHPSCYGIREIYLPCIRELVEDIASIYRNS